jgi:hypothetical protein
MNDEKKISRADIFLLTGIIFLCGIVLLCFYLFKKPGRSVDIMISGETVKTVKLDETAAYIIYGSQETVNSGDNDNGDNENGDNESDMETDAKIDTPISVNSENFVVDGKTISIVKCNKDEIGKLSGIGSYNVMIVENNTINIIDADCPDKICVNHSTIENVGETIICLPHKLVVEIKEND